MSTTTLLLQHCIPLRYTTSSILLSSPSEHYFLSALPFYLSTDPLPRFSCSFFLASTVDPTTRLFDKPGLFHFHLERNHTLIVDYLARSLDRSHHFREFLPSLPLRLLRVYSLYSNFCLHQQQLYLPATLPTSTYRYLSCLAISPES